MRRAAKAAGRANLVIVNTCAVTAEATRQARQAIRRIKRERPEVEIVVTGCAAQIAPDRFTTMPEVSQVLGNAAKSDPAAWARRRAGSNVPDIMAAPRALTPSEGTEDHTRAFLAAQSGCDHRCTFCIIPYARGPSRSLPLEGAVQAARRLAEKGFREIVLTGVDLTSYGTDLYGVPALDRLRLSSIDCIEADGALVEAFADEPRLMPHLHLSLQSGDDLILKRMKRRHLRADAVRFCEELRRIRPEIVFGADLIAGFPTETEKMFQNTLALIEDCGLTRLHVFPFSPRPGTPAARMQQLAPDIVKDRARRLREAGAAALQRHLDMQIGKVLRVLTERGGIGHAEDFTRVRVGEAAPGQMIEVAIVGSEDKMLDGDTRVNCSV